MSSTTLRDRDFQRILVIKPSALGDVIHALPVLVKLRSRYPSARIDWLITPQNADLLRHHPARPNLIYFDRAAANHASRWAGAAADYVSLVKQLRSARYELVIDLHGQLRSALFCLITGAPCRIGFGRPLTDSEIGEEAGPWRGWRGARESAWIAYNHPIPFGDMRAHAIDRYLWLEPLLSLDDSPPDCRVHVDANTRERVRALVAKHLSGGERYAVFAPGTTWETKHWRPDGFAEVARALMNDGVKVFLVGAGRDRERCEAVAREAPGCVNLCGTTSVAELAALMYGASVCLTNDSGPMHLAVATGRPVVSVFGPTDPIRIGPYGQIESVVTAGTPCSGCYLRQIRDCRHEHTCMRDVTSEAVLRVLHRFVAQHA